MSGTFRRLFVLCAAALIALSAPGCGKKGKIVDPVPVLTQEDADDMVQQVAMMIAADQGGWLVDLQSTRESMPLNVPAVPGPMSLSQRVLMMPASSRGGGFRTNRDTLVTVASMNYAFFYFYTDTLGDSLGSYTPDTSGVIQVDGISTATGTIAATGFNGFLSHKGDPLTGTGFEAASDTINFSGVGDDSLFTTFTPAFRTGTRYFSTVSFVDYDVKMLRNPAANPFPISGEANAFLFADVLRSPNPSDFYTTLEGTVTYYFDGTQTPIVGITNDLDSPIPKFRYRADLRTGTITRLP
jgi:hypothetical protein